MAFRGTPRAQVNFKCEELLKALLCMLNLHPLQNASQACNTNLSSRALRVLANDDMQRLDCAAGYTPRFAHS